MKNRSKLTLIALILAGEGVFFLPFVLARVFRPTMLEVFNFTNLELGTAFSVYGIVAMVSYFFGGPLADRFSARLLLSSALVLTALGGLYMATIPGFQGFVLLYGFFGFTTIFLFWAAMIKATRIWGGSGYQGRAFGFLEGGRGLTAALIATITLTIFSYSTGDSIIGQRDTSFQTIIIITSLVVLAIGILAWFAIPKVNDQSKLNRLPRASDIIVVAKRPLVWLQAIIIICAYVGYKATDDFSLYANQVLGKTEVAAAGIGTLSLWMRPIFALLAGFLADRFSSPKVAVWSFGIMIFSSALIAIGVLESLTYFSVLALLSTLIGVYGIRGIYFALMEDAAIPVVATGTAVGIISVLGFTPDVFMSPLMGWLLDSFPGAPGHRYVFLVLMLFSLIGFLASIRFTKITKRMR